MKLSNPYKKMPQEQKVGGICSSIFFVNIFTYNFEPFYLLAWCNGGRIVAYFLRGFFNPRIPGVSTF